MEKQIIKLHKAGLSNRQIAVSLSLGHHCKVSKVLDKHNLEPNGGRKHKLLIKDSDGLCTKCNKWLPLSTFKINRRGEQSQYRLTFCNKCGWAQRNKYLNSNSDAYFKDRFNTLKQHAKRRGQEFDFALDDVLWLYKVQSGKCAYTGEKLKLEKGIGLIDETMSFDRFNPRLGYVKGNVVLCTKRANVIKSNLTPELFKKYMPRLFNRGVKVIRMWREKGLDVEDVGDGVEF